MRMGFLGALAAVACVWAGIASAVPVNFCKDGPGIDLASGCISVAGDGIYSNSGGGDRETAVEAAILGAIGSAVDIALYGKSDDNPELFTLTGMGGTSGTWSVLAGTLIRYITVKAANSFALYDVGGMSSGTWTTAGLLSKAGQQPDVSHISFWTADPVIAPVPLPAAGLLLVGALGLLGAASRRRSA